MKRTLLFLAGPVLALYAATNAPLEKYTAAERRHWSFRAISSPAPPVFGDAEAKAWVKTPVDAFILDRLRKEGLKPAPRAGRATLIRRVTFDLTGLPPTPAEVAAFVADKTPKAWEAVIDRLLASPHYGEQWGRHWLDVVRFAESDGFEYDTHRRDAYRYRDYVIHSFNSDKPYDQFLREQIAGDEIAPQNETMRIASGLHRLGPLRKNAGNQEVASSRNEVLTEMTNTMGSAVLGVTLGCARCHDHKFDPIRHTDYYRMQGYFSQTHESDVPLATAEEQATWKAQTDAVDKEMKSLKSRMKKMQGDELKLMEQKLKDVEAKMPEPLPSLYSVSNDAAKLTPVHVLARGEYTNKGAAVGMRPMGVLIPEDSPELPLDTAQPRQKLAEWLTATSNPLPARVMMNRVFQGHFGRGIVATPNDFGRMGARPTHPELLDFLATEYQKSGWKLKPMHKLILLSSAYQQASTSPVETVAKAKDADNKWLWKFNRRRLEAEEIRDAGLAVAGKLNPKAGGPSIIVPIDPGLTILLYKPSQWAVTKEATEHDRRSVYLLQKRNLRLPFMEVFDSPDLALSCPRREQSTHAPQALELLNGDFSNAMAETLAARLEREAPKQPLKQIDLAWKLTTGRAPSLKERALAQQYLAKGSLREFSLAVLNLNAYLYVN